MISRVLFFLCVWQLMYTTCLHVLPERKHSKPRMSWRLHRNVVLSLRTVLFVDVWGWADFDASPAFWQNISMASKLILLDLEVPHLILPSPDVYRKNHPYCLQKRKNSLRWIDFDIFIIILTLYLYYYHPLLKHNVKKKNPSGVIFFWKVSQEYNFFPPPKKHSHFLQPDTQTIQPSRGT